MTVEVWRALVLGALQGATEFLPVSSSGHLVIVPELLGWPAASLTFDVAVHWATALAVMAYFRADWARLLVAAARSLRADPDARTSEARLVGLLAASTVPAVLAGLALQGPLSHALESDPRAMARLASMLLLVTGGLLLLSEHFGARTRAAEAIGARGALGVGLAQAFAILPGISRSGATIAAGLGAGLERPEAARFSFLLATPIILGAGFLQLADLVAAGPDPGELRELVAGFLTALVVGYASIGWLLRYLRHASLHVFVAYTWIAGLAALWALR